MSKRLLSALMAALALTIGGGCLRQLIRDSTSGGSSGGPLVGAGSTLVAPLMSKWQSDFASKTEETVTYGAIGSGGGIDQITSRTVDFGASDAPLTEEQFEEANGVEQIPWALSGTVPAYNVSGAPKNLKLNGEVLAGIYLGKITSWDDPAIAKLNPGASLPSTKITPVYRSDGSGDTYAFTNYLSTIEPRIQVERRAPRPRSSSRPASAPKRTTASLRRSRQTDGAIGYVGLAYALSNELSMPLVENSAGSFPEPGVESVEAAADAVSKIGPNNEISLADLPSTAKARTRSRPTPT